MNNLKPLLTIAIPTFNRVNSLRRSLGAIVRQIDAMECGWEKIEVIVSDNCSTDETKQLVQEFRQRSNIIYFRNSVNLGMEGNFLTCFEKANGNLVWTFSDDDIILDEALQQIVNLINNKPVDIIYLHPKFLFGELDSFSTKSVKFNINPVSADYFALRANGLLSFLSAVIVNKDRYLSLRRDNNTRRYAGTWLAHYEWIYTLLSDGKFFYVADKSMIRARTGATGGYDIFEVFGKHYVGIGNEKLSQKPRMRKDLENAMLYMHIPGFIASCRAKSFGKFEYIPERIAKQILDAYGDSFFYRVIIINQLFGNFLFASVAFRFSQIYSRCWSHYRRLANKLYEFLGRGLVFKDFIK